MKDFFCETLPHLLMAVETLPFDNSETCPSFDKLDTRYNKTSHSYN